MDEKVYWDARGVNDLIHAIMQQGVEDVYQGDPSAIAWLDSPSFDHWCAWLDIDPVAARESIHARRLTRKAGRLAEAKLSQAYDRNQRGEPQAKVLKEVFGYYSETLRQRYLWYCQHVATAA